MHLRYQTEKYMSNEIEGRHYSAWLGIVYNTMGNINHLNSIPAKSDMLSLTDSAWESQNVASWDTVLFHMSYWIHTNLHSYGTVGYSKITVYTSRCTM